MIVKFAIIYFIACRRAAVDGASVKNGHNHIQGVRDKANAILATVMTALSR
jgi:alpha-D-ribose 1-methylphosphonate 5-triphosphate synthase subunit PhnG